MVVKEADETDVFYYYRIVDNYYYNLVEVHSEDAGLPVS
jgi:hypothetical protein